MRVLFFVGLIIDMPVGRPRDIAQAQPVSNTISMFFTNVKGPWTPASTKGEVYAQSFIEGDTKFLRRYYLKYRTGATVGKCFVGGRNKIAWLLFGWCT